MPQSMQAQFEAKLFPRFRRDRDDAVPPPPDSPLPAPPPGATTDFRNLIDAAVAVIKDGKITREDQDEIVAVMEDLFERFVRPFDIPYVPNVVEKWVDDAIKATIPRIVEQIFNRFVPA